MEKALPDRMTMNKIPPELEHKLRSESMCELQAELKQEIPDRLEKKYQEKLAQAMQKEDKP